MLTARAFAGETGEPVKARAPTQGRAFARAFAAGIEIKPGGAATAPLRAPGDSPAGGADLAGSASNLQILQMGRSRWGRRDSNPHGFEPT